MEVGAFILDFSGGSGRDTKYFLERGYRVDTIDESEELCKIASEYTGIEVKKLLFQELQEVEKYDALWTGSSILRLSYEELVDVMKKMLAVIKKQDLIYVSFKYGTFEKTIARHRWN